ncbi:MAG: NAD(P)-dependent oxidoreductase [Chthoniobacterales bacterium]
MTSQIKPSVGVIGLGIIGSRVVANLRREGVSVFVWNRSPKVESNFLSSPLEVAEAADIVQIFVCDGGALIEALRQMSPALTAGHVILNHATISPAETREAAEMVAKRGAQFLDAPFTGSRDAAVDGKLVYYIGGSPKVLESVRPILKISSQEILMMGPIGAATYVKLATNLINAAQVQGLAEALELLTVGDVPLHRIAEALQHNVARSDVIDMKLLQILKADFEPRFSSKNMLKDLQIILRLMAARDVHLPAAEGAAVALAETLERGWGESDYSVVACRYSYPGKDHHLPLSKTSYRTTGDQREKRVAGSLRKTFMERFFFWL